VRANWAGRGVLYPGEVLAINHEDDTVDILYDDGDFESHVPRERVHAVSIELTDSFHAFGLGDVVKADLKGHGSWYTGRIISIDTKFRVSSRVGRGVPSASCWVLPLVCLCPVASCSLPSPSQQCPRCWSYTPAAMQVFTIKYENGHLEKHVPPSRVQPLSTGHIKYLALCVTAFVHFRSFPRQPSLASLYAMQATVHIAARHCTISTSTACVLFPTVQVRLRAWRARACQLAELRHMVFGTHLVRI